MLPLRSIYYFGGKEGIKVYNNDNNLCGVTTGFIARPNGHPESIGEVEVRLGQKCTWIKGYGRHIVGFGIKLE